MERTIIMEYRELYKLLMLPKCAVAPNTSVASQLTGVPNTSAFPELDLEEEVVT
jgi:hypothetical protein